jgi:hypothetical protein
MYIQRVNIHSSKIVIFIRILRRKSTIVPMAIGGQSQLNNEKELLESVEELYEDYVPCGAEKSQHPDAVSF